MARLLLSLKLNLTFLIIVVSPDVSSCTGKLWFCFENQAVLARLYAYTALQCDKTLLL